MLLSVLSDFGDFISPSPDVHKTRQRSGPHRILANLAKRLPTIFACAVLN
jgi:hypothetical protein